MSYSSTTNLGLPENPTGVPDELYAQFESIYNAIKNLRAAFDSGSITSGTFTPVVKFGGNSVGIAYAVQQGTYRIVQKSILFWQVRVTLTNKGSSVGNASIGNFPSITGPGQASVNVSSFLNFNNRPVGGAPISGTEFVLYKDNAGTVAIVQDTDWTNTSEFIASGFYFL